MQPIQQALEDYRLGPCSLAAAAEQAGVSLREMIILARANGLAPKVDPKLLATRLRREQAQDL